MKKILLLAVAILLYTGIHAQIVSSRSVGTTTTSNRTSKTEHLWRVGLNMMNFAGDGGEDLDKKIGYNITYSFLKPMGSIGTYWGMEFGLGSRGYKFKEDSYEENLIAHNIQYSPFTFGWKYEIINNFKVDVHLGAFASVDYVGKYKNDKIESNIKDWGDWNRYDAGLNAGFGVWYSRFNLDFTFQRGFIETEDESEAFTNNFMLRLGVAF